MQQLYQGRLTKILSNLTSKKVWDNTKMKKKQKSDVSFFRVETPEGYFR